jgi:hypothetical protein
VDDSEETGWDAAIERLELPVEPGTAMRADAWIALQTGSQEPPPPAGSKKDA